MRQLKRRVFTMEAPNRSFMQRRRRLSLTLMLLLGLAASIEGVAQNSVPTTQTRNNLTPIQWPDVTKLEPEVRDQLVTLEKTLRAVINNPSLPDAARANDFADAGRIYHAYSLTVPARQCYLNANALAPKDFRWPYLLAKIDQQEGRIEDAISRFEQAGRLNSEYVPVDVNLGNIYLELNRVEQANASFAKALQREPKNPAALYGLGQLALSDRRYSDASGYFEKALEQVPAANRIHYSLAMAYRGLGNLSRAEAHLAQRGTVGVRVVDPLFDELRELIEGERIYLVRGHTALEAKRFADAATEFRKAIAARPDSVTAHLNLGTTLVQMHDPEAAVAEFKTVIQLDPGNSNARFNLALVFSKLERHHEAIDTLQDLLKINPKDSVARVFLANQLLRVDRLDEALTEFLRVAQAEPDNEEALVSGAKLLIQTRQYRKALNLLEQSNALYPQKPDTCVTLAYLLATAPQTDLRDGARALELAQKAFQTSGLPQHGAIVTLALAELGRCTEAADWQKKMIVLAEQQRQTDLASRLNGELTLYEGKGACRPE